MSILRANLGIVLQRLESCPSAGTMQAQ